MTKRKSVSLSKQVKGEILHRFFMDVSKDARAKLIGLEHETALRVYDIIYGDIAPVIDEMPDDMLTFYQDMPMPGLDVKKRKRARVKGKIEPTESEHFQFRAFSNHVNLDRTAATIARDDLETPYRLAQYSSNRGLTRSAHCHLDRLMDRGKITKGARSRIDAIYIKACKDGKALYMPIVEIMKGVVEILQFVKSTKGLIEAWPGCERYLALPEESQGALMKVDVDKLDKALGELYPPAEKTRGA